MVSWSAGGLLRYRGGLLVVSFLSPCGLLLVLVVLVVEVVERRRGASSLLPELTLE